MSMVRFLVVIALALFALGSARVAAACENPPCPRPAPQLAPADSVQP
jgi:hypothetical protein